MQRAPGASRLKLLPTMAKECRKYGLSLIVASQAAKDFNPALYSAVANYLILRVTDADAKVLAKNTAKSEDAQRIAGRLKQLDKYTAMFFCEGHGGLPRSITFMDNVLHTLIDEE
jgi:DNA helicase HerA-like ATPase